MFSVWRLPLPHDAEQALAQDYLDSIDDAAGVQSIVPGDEGAPAPIAAVLFMPEQRCRLQTRVQLVVAYLRHTPRAQNNRCAQCAARRLYCSTTL